MPIDEGVRFDDCMCIKETAKAILVDIADLDEERWIPKSAIHEDSEVYQLDDEGQLVVVTWWAEKEGLE